MTSNTTLSEVQRALINQMVDGELSPAQQIDFDQLMASSEAAKLYFGQLQKVNEALTQLPEIKVPNELKQAVLSQIPNSAPQRPRSAFGNWLDRIWNSDAPAPRHWQAGGAAIAVAAVIVIGIPHLNQLGFTEQDRQAAVGTLLPSSKHLPEQRLDSVKIESPALSAKLDLLKQADQLMLKLDILETADKAIELEVLGDDYRITAWSNEKVASEEAQKTTVLNNTNAKQFTFIVTPQTSIETASTAPLSVQITADKKLIFKGKLRIPENN